MIGRVGFCKSSGFFVSQESLMDSSSHWTPLEIFRILGDFGVIGVLLFPEIIRQMFFGMRRNSDIPLTGTTVCLKTDIVVRHLETVVVDSEAIAFVNIYRLVGLVLDFYKIETLFLVIVNGIINPFLQDVDFDVVVGHDGIAVDAKDGGKRVGSKWTCHLI